MTGRALIVLAAFAATAGAGELTRRFERSLDRALADGVPRYTEEFLLADLSAAPERRFGSFSGDLSGRYLGAMAKSGPRGIEVARAFAPRIWALQQADGGFGRPFSPSGADRRDMTKLWGHGRLLVGLLDYFEGTGDAQALAAARRLGDHLSAQADRFNAPAIRQALGASGGAEGYICWTQNIEGLARLAKATGDDRYRRIAGAIADTFEARPNLHAHGALSTLRGILLLAEADPAYLARNEREWDALVDAGNVRWYGGPPEYLGAFGRDEGCASADWLRFNLGLWRLTGRLRYLDAAEDALFNAFFGNQYPNGGFGHLNLRMEGIASGPTEAWWCCTLHGLRTFPETRDAAFRAEGGALYYDLPVDARGVVGELELVAEAELARDGKVTLRVVRAPSAPVAVHLRKPARTAELRSEHGSSREAWLVLEREWRPGERIEIDYSFDLEVVRLRGATVVRRGPWTLGVSEGLDPAFFNEGFQSHRIDFQTLAAGDRPSRAAAEFHASGFAGQPAPLTFRPVGERWEEPAHAMRWTTRFDLDPGRGDPLRIRVIRALYENRIALVAGFVAGMIFVGVSLWLWRRLRRAR